MHPRPVSPEMILDARLQFPLPQQAPPDGLVAVGGDFQPERLLLAYRSGIFPWSANPITWWSPDPRGIFELDQFHVPRRLAQLLRRPPYIVTRNRAFRAVMAGCAVATPQRGRSWITPEFIAGYTRLHELGHAHSVECWRNDELVGGIYGVAVGGLFAGESMFHRADHASKIALVHLVDHLRGQGFQLFDLQMVTALTRQFGAIEISRADYLQHLKPALAANCQF